MSRRIAIIFGAGPGLGAALAQALSKTHSLLLLSRSLPGSLPKLDLRIPNMDSTVLACQSDGSRESLDAAMKAMKDKWPEGKVDVGISHAGPKFALGSFLDVSEDIMRENTDFFVKGSVNFAQAVIPAMLPHGGTFIFTGATMGIRGSAQFSSCAPMAFARRGLSQSLAKEFGPKGVHVAHVVIDGLIDTERVKGMMGEVKDDNTRLKPDEIAQAYISLINQPKSAWTQEMDLRPMHEKW